jgi:DNA-binding NtrC family response regulator
MPYKIMIVDDEPANLRLLERLFRRDYTVVAAASGDEALHLLGQHDIALLITDQRMPGMTGIELLQRTASLRPHMVRIILTGYTDMTALVEAINCGHVYKYITKPWDNNALRLTVERALEHYETNRSLHELEQANKRLSIRLQEVTALLLDVANVIANAKDLDEVKSLDALDPDGLTMLGLGNRDFARIYTETAGAVGSSYAMSD